MFEDYLQDSYEFFSLAEVEAQQCHEREAKRYFRASVFYASGAIESFINYIAASFALAGNIEKHEICFINDKSLIFTVKSGLIEKNEYHSIEDKIRLILRRFASSYDFGCLPWCKFIEFKRFRDSLVHPHELDDEIDLSQYHKKVSSGLKATIEIMNSISLAVSHEPLRKQLLDLIPE